MLNENAIPHQSPRFDINGLPMRPFTVAQAPQYRVPREWNKTPETRTRTELLEKRRKEFIPDITYDIDGDGFVDHKDMAIAKMFDKNKDGILDEHERSEMQKAFRDGTLDKYIWGLDQGGSGRHPRIIQKKGRVFTDGNYEKQSQCKNKSDGNYNKTLTIIRETAKNEKKEKAAEASEKWFESHPTKIEYVPYRIYNPAPQFKTITEKKQKIASEAREKIGLSERTDINDHSKDPKFTYVHNPQHSSLKEFKTSRKQKTVANI